MGLADLYDRFQAIVALERRVHVLEEGLETVLPRMEELSLSIVRLAGRIETVKAETIAEFYRQVAGPPAAPLRRRPDRPALRPRGTPRRRR